MPSSKAFVQQYLHTFVCWQLSGHQYCNCLLIVSHVHVYTVRSISSSSPNQHMSVFHSVNTTYVLVGTCSNMQKYMYMLTTTVCNLVSVLESNGCQKFFRVVLQSFSLVASFSCQTFSMVINARGYVQCLSSTRRKQRQTARCLRDHVNSLTVTRWTCSIVDCGIKLVSVCRRIYCICPPQLLSYSV